MTKGSLMKVESIAKCSPWSILQCFWPVLSDNWSGKPICGLFESGLYTQNLLYFSKSHTENIHVPPRFSPLRKLGPSNTRTWNYNVNPYFIDIMLSRVASAYPIYPSYYLISIFWIYCILPVCGSSRSAFLPVRGSSRSACEVPIIYFSRYLLFFYLLWENHFFLEK